MKQKLIACMCIKNEEYFLPGFLKHIRNFVDGICVLDDGSTDKTLEILKKEPKVQKIIELPVHSSLEWDEKGNREKVIRAASDLGANWVLCCDPDERFEKNFLKNMRKLINSDKKNVYGVHFRECWESWKKYRSDGIWNKKEKYILFPLQEKMTFEFKQNHHIFWHYKELNQNLYLLPYNLYHLKMIREEERIKRVNLYNTLDPNLEMQPIGYDYLIDEKNIELSLIKFKNRFDYSTLPTDLKKEFKI